jgi:predicted ATP-grasp superfamily ATP-dependent carboligase
MFNVEGIDVKTKDLEKQADKLVDDLKKLEERHKKGEFDDNTYKERRREIERAIVEVMDRLAQMRFLSGQT